MERQRKKGKHRLHLKEGIVGKERDRASVLEWDGARWGEPRNKSVEKQKTSGSGRAGGKSEPTTELMTQEGSVDSMRIGEVRENRGKDWRTSWDIRY